MSVTRFMYVIASPRMALKPDPLLQIFRFVQSQGALSETRTDLLGR